MEIFGVMSHPHHQFKRMPRLGPQDQYYNWPTFVCLIVSLDSSIASTLHLGTSIFYHNKIGGTWVQCPENPRIQQVGRPVIKLMYRMTCVLYLPIQKIIYFMYFILQSFCIKFIAIIITWHPLFDGDQSASVCAWLVEILVVFPRPTGDMLTSLGFSLLNWGIFLSVFLRFFLNGWVIKFS